MVEILSQNTIKQMVDRVVTGVAPKKVLLFGSYAWGRPNAGSDIDLLVILETNLSRRDRRRKVSDTLRPRLAPVDIFVYTPSEIQKAQKKVGSFVSEILKRGKLLYEQK